MAARGRQKVDCYVYGRSKPKPLTAAERKAALEWARTVREIESVGSRRYCAQAIVQRLDESNCERWGVSKVDLFRLREVAHGCGA